MKNFVLVHEMARSVKSGIFDHFIERISPETKGKDWFINNESEPYFSVDDINSIIHHHHRPQFSKLGHGINVTTMHFDLDDTDHTLEVHKYLEFLKNNHSIICLNTKQKSDLIEIGIGSDKIVVIPHGYDENVFCSEHRLNVGKARSERNKSRDKLVIGINSRYYLRGVKGENSIISIARRLSVEKFKFLLRGKDRNYLAQILSALGFDVSVSEEKHYEDITEFYCGVDILLMTSWYEGGPASLPEALASGIPVLARKVGMVHDYHSSCIIFESELDAVNKLYELRNELSKGVISESNESMCMGLLTWNEVKAEYLKLYRSVYEHSI